jgi:hypothetical protein
VNVCSRTNRAKKKGHDLQIEGIETKDGHTACSQEKQISCCVKAPELVELIFRELYNLLDPRERPALRDRGRWISKNI